MELETNSLTLMNGSFNKKRKRIFPVEPGDFAEHETHDQLEKNQILEDDEEDDKEFEILEVFIILISNTELFFFQNVKQSKVKKSHYVFDFILGFIWII